MKTLLSDLHSDTRGAAIIELAIMAPVLALMTVGVVDLSNGFSRKVQLEQAAQRAIEKVMNTTGLQTVEETIQSEAAAQAKIPISQVTVHYRLECDGAVSTATSCATGSKEARWISVEVRDTFRPMFKMRFKGAQGDGTYALKATAGMRVK